MSVTNRDLVLAIDYLKRIPARGHEDGDVLYGLVVRLENELVRRRKKSEQ